MPFTPAALDWRTPGPWTSVFDVLLADHEVCMVSKSTVSHARLGLPSTYQSRVTKPLLYGRTSPNVLPNPQRVLRIPHGFHTYTRRQKIN